MEVVTDFVFFNERSHCNKKPEDPAQQQINKYIYFLKCNTSSPSSSDLDGLSHQCSSPSLTISACLMAMLTLYLCCGCTWSSFYLRTHPEGTDPSPPWVPQHPVQTLVEETQTLVTKGKL